MHHFQVENVDFVCEEDFAPVNIMDQWILSFTQSLLTFVREEMASKWVELGGRGCVWEHHCLLIGSELVQN